MTTPRKHAIPVSQGGDPRDYRTPGTRYTLIKSTCLYCDLPQPLTLIFTCSICYENVCLDHDCRCFQLMASIHGKEED